MHYLCTRNQEVTTTLKAQTVLREVFEKKKLPKHLVNSKICIIFAPLFRSKKEWW